MNDQEPVGLNLSVPYITATAKDMERKKWLTSSGYWICVCFASVVIVIAIVDWMSAVHIGGRPTHDSTFLFCLVAALAALAGFALKQQDDQLKRIVNWANDVAYLLQKKEDRASDSKSPISGPQG